MMALNKLYFEDLELYYYNYKKKKKKVFYYFFQNLDNFISKKKRNK